MLLAPTVVGGGVLWEKNRKIAVAAETSAAIVAAASFGLRFDQRQVRVGGRTGRAMKMATLRSLFHLPSIPHYTKSSPPITFSGTSPKISGTGITEHKYHEGRNRNENHQRRKQIKTIIKPIYPLLPAFTLGCFGLSPMMREATPEPTASIAEQQTTTRRNTHNEHP
jgi:hypothetical protein